MAKVKYEGGAVLRWVPVLDRGPILPGQVVECPDEYVYNLTLQDIWTAHDADAKRLHDEGYEAEQARLNPQPSADLDPDSDEALLKASRKRGKTENPEG